jgi:precorrin-4 methylase
VTTLLASTAQSTSNAAGVSSLSSAASSTMSSFRRPPAGVTVLTARTSARDPFFIALDALSNFSMSPATFFGEKKQQKTKPG